MDTTEQYIKMCKKAREIQDYTMTHCIRVPILPMVGIAVGDRGDFFEAHGVWLPRQDQLQEMVLPDWDKKDAWGDYIEPDMKTDYVFWMFQDFVKSIQERKWTRQTAEQLWIRYVMAKKYNKTWDGEEWV